MSHINMETNVASINNDCEIMNESSDKDKGIANIMDININNSGKLIQDEKNSTATYAEQPPTSASFPASPTSATSSTSPASSYYYPPSTPGTSLPSSPVSPSMLVDEEVTSETPNIQSRRYFFPLEDLNANVSNTTQNDSEECTKENQNSAVMSNQLFSGVKRTQCPEVNNDGYIVTFQKSSTSSPSLEMQQNNQNTGLATELEQVPHNHGYATNKKLILQKEKMIWSKDSISVHLSKIYCIAVIMVGILIYVADSFRPNHFILSEIFNIYLMVVQIIWLALLHIDVRKYLQFVSETVARAQEPQLDSSKSENHKPLKNITASDRYYGFTSGRHFVGGSLYLKAGATVFFFGYAIWIGLNLGTTIQHLDDDTCYNTSHVVMITMEIVHVAYQLFFVFKYSNLIINRWINFSRFGVMHCIATSTCLCFFLLYIQILSAIDEQNSFDRTDSSDSIKLHEPIHPFNLTATDSSDSIKLHEPIYPFNLTATSVPPITISLKNNWNILYGCQNSSKIDEVYYAASPYLFPFAIEFNLVIIGLWFAIWQNFGKMEIHTHYPSVLIKTEEDQSKSFYSNLFISVDCHSSNRGLFAGLLTMIFTIISIIIFFVYTYEDVGTEEDETFRAGLIIRGATEGVLLLILLGTTMIAFSSIKTLDIVQASFSSVDNLLLIITLPFIFFFAMCNMVSYSNAAQDDGIPSQEWLFIPVLILYVIQPVVQTVFICDAFHRCSNTNALQKKKPGREAVTYLIVTNVTMWLFETMQINTHGANREGLDFYHPVTWQVISHLSMPFSVFFRFHSSACLADIWYYAYEVDA